MRWWTLVIMVGCAVLSACSSGDEVVTVAWQRAEVLPDGRVELTYPADEYRSDSCWAAEPELGYTEDTVAIDLKFRRVSEFCTAEGVNAARVVVEVPEPVGDRTIVAA